MRTNSKRVAWLSLFVLLAVTGRAQYFEYQGLWYQQLTETTAEVTIQMYHQSKTEGDIVVPEYVEYDGQQLQVTGISDNAFAYTGITSLTLDHVTAFGTYVFSVCQSLTRVSLPDGMQELPAGTFSGCAALCELYVPQQLERIGMQCFQGCSSLQRLAFPVTMKEIGERAFKDCTALQEVTLSDGVEAIPYECFSGCSSLRSFQIPTAVKTIGEGAFVDSGIESVTLPEGLQRIYSRAFSCRQLGEIILLNPKMAGVSSYHVSSDAFSKPVLYFATLHVPEGSRAYYLRQEVWKEFQDMVEDNVSGKEYCEVQVQVTGLSSVTVNDESVNALLEPWWMEIEKGEPLKLTILLDDGSGVSGSTRYVASVRVNGEEMLSQMAVDGNRYELSVDAVSDNLDILVDIPWRSYAVTLSQSSGGSIYVIPPSKTRMDVRVTAADGYRIARIDDYSSFWQYSEHPSHNGHTGVIHYDDYTRDDHTITVTYKKQ